MINLLVVDDHPLVQLGLKSLFDSAGDIAVAGEAADGVQAIELLRRGIHCDLVLLDLIMPGMPWNDLMTDIRKVSAALPILIHSMHTELQVARRVFEKGASGYVTKGSPSEMLISAIHKVAGGGRYVDPVLSEQLANRGHLGEGSLPHEMLSERELGILRLIAGGLTGKEIARELSISDKTVSTHKTRLMQKMGFNNEIELLRYALKYGLDE